MRSSFFRLEFKIFCWYLLLNDTIPMMRNCQLFDICKTFQYNLKWLDMLYWKEFHKIEMPLTILFEKLHNKFYNFCVVRIDGF